LKVPNKAGLDGPPWVWTRRVLARHWGCRPWDVDEWPADEVVLELRLLALEAEHKDKS